MVWTTVGLAGRRAFTTGINIRYFLDENIKETGYVEYRARNIYNGSIVPLLGNQGKSIIPYVYLQGESWFPLRGYPYVFSNELPGVFYVKLNGV